jgi:hypothetical protein
MAASLRLVVVVLAGLGGGERGVPLHELAALDQLDLKMILVE